MWFVCKPQKLKLEFLKDWTTKKKKKIVTNKQQSSLSQVYAMYIYTQIPIFFGTLVSSSLITLKLLTLNYFLTLSLSNSFLLLSLKTLSCSVSLPNSLSSLSPAFSCPFFFSQVLSCPLSPKLCYSLYLSNSLYLLPSTLFLFLLWWVKSKSQQRILSVSTWTKLFLLCSFLALDFKDISGIKSAMRLRILWDPPTQFQLLIFLIGESWVSNIHTKFS